MECEGCGVEALVMKTCRWRTGAFHFTLCDPCWEPLAASVWIIPGQEIAAARCDGCGHWLHPDGMTELRRGGRWDGFGGVCFSCREVATAILKTIELSVESEATFRVGWQHVYGCSFKLYLSCC